MIKEQFCNFTQGFGLFSAQVWTGQLDIILGCSSVLQLLVAYSIFMNRKLAAHPADLVGFMALTDGFFAYLGLTRYLICGSQTWVDQLFAWTVLYSDDTDRAFQILSKAYLFFLSFSFILFTCLTLFICVDLVLTMRNPFRSPSARARWYYLASLSASLVCTMIIRS